MTNMRNLISFAALAALVSLPLATPMPAAAEDEPNWQACIDLASNPDERVTACSAVIDAKSETGRKLAAAY